MQAWRAVDRAFVDKSFNGQSWFRLREQYLRNEPMRDREETYAAIRKMLATLDDPFTRFLDASRYAQLKRGASGAVTGVGLEVAFSQAKDRAGQLLVCRSHPGCQVCELPAATLALRSRRQHRIAWRHSTGCTRLCGRLAASSAV